MSTIKNTYDNVESIPEGLESIYTKQDDGSFKVNVEGQVDKGRVDEFRENNINLRKEIEGFEAKQLENDNSMAEMRKQISDMEGKQSLNSIEENDAVWKKRNEERDTAHEADRVKWADDRSNWESEKFQRDAAGEVLNWAGKNIIPDGQEHFIKVVTDMISKDDNGSYVIESRPMKEWLNDLNNESKFGYIMHQATSTGPGTGGTETTPFSGVKTEDISTHDTILAGLTALGK